MLIGTGTDADDPSERVATRSAETVVCPTGTAASGNGNVACHCPSPVWLNPIVCVPICSFSAVAFVVVTAAARTDVPFATTVGESVAKKICTGSVGFAKLLCGGDPNVKTLVCANALGTGDGAGDAGGHIRGGDICGGDICGDAVSGDGVPGPVGGGTTAPAGTRPPRRPGAGGGATIWPLGGGRCVFGGSVGSGAGVGIARSAGPGSAVFPGFSTWGVTTMISSLR